MAFTDKHRKLSISEVSAEHDSSSKTHPTNQGAVFSVFFHSGSVLNTALSNGTSEGRVIVRWKVAADKFSQPRLKTKGLQFYLLLNRNHISVRHIMKTSTYQWNGEGFLMVECLSKQRLSVCLIYIYHCLTKRNKNNRWSYVEELFLGTGHRDSVFPGGWIHGC